MPGKSMSYKKSSKKSYGKRYPKSSRRYKKRRPITDAKYIDLDLRTSNATTTGDIFLIPTIPQGTTVNTRIGKKIEYSSIQIRGNVQGGTAAAAPGQVAFYLIYDKQPTGSLPAITDILESASALSFLNDNNSDRFVILKKHRLMVIGDGDSATAQNCCTAYDVDLWMKLKHRAIYKALGTGAIDDFNYGALYGLVVGNLGTTANIFPVWQCTYRVRYHDISG